MHKRTCIHLKIEIDGRIQEYKKNKYIKKQDIQIYKTQKYVLNNSVFYLFLYLSLFISKLLALVTN